MSEARLRRPNFTEQERQSWREKESQGMKRSQIAKESGVDPSVITRHLGAKRKYAARLTEEDKAEIASELSSNS